MPKVVAKVQYPVQAFSAKKFNYFFHQISLYLYSKRKGSNFKSSTHSRFRLNCHTVDSSLTQQIIQNFQVPDKEWSESSEGLKPLIKPISHSQP
jgi:hypothetical protein